MNEEPSRALLQHVEEFGSDAGEAFGNVALVLQRWGRQRASSCLWLNFSHPRKNQGKQKNIGKEPPTIQKLAGQRKERWKKDRSKRIRGRSQREEHWEKEMSRNERVAWSGKEDKTSRINFS